MVQKSIVSPEMIRPFKDSTDQIGTPHDLQQSLHDDGYLFLRGVLDQEEILAARTEVFARLATVGEVKEPIVSGLFSGTSQRREKHDDLGTFWKSVCEGDKLRQVTHGAGLRALMADIFGEPARPHDYIFLRPSPVGRATPLHYDMPFFARGSKRIYTVWLALGPVPVSDGPLVIVKGSNRFDDLLESAIDVDYDSKSGPSVSVMDDPVALAQARGTHLLSADFEAGDLVVFAMTILHGTLDNHSAQDRIRLSCDIRYQPLSDPMDARYSGPDPTGTTGIGYGELNGAKPLTEPWHTR